MTPVPTNSTPSRPCRTVSRRGVVQIVAVTALAAAAVTSTGAPAQATRPAQGDSPPSITVSYQDPPPDLLIYPFAVLDLPTDLEYPYLPDVAAAPGGDTYVIDGEHDAGYVVSSDGGVAGPIPLSAWPRFPVAGPDGVVYGIQSTEGAPQMVAMPMTGDNAGTVVASAPITDSRPYLELPVGVFGNSDSGVADRVRDVGSVLISYVDANGDPAAAVDYPPLLQQDGQRVFVAEDPSIVWPISIERSPDFSPGAASGGESPPAWIGVGAAAVFTSIGPPEDLANPEDGPTVPVIAFLNSDGSGKWFSIADGWRVASADVDGLVFIRRVDDAVQLAHVVSDDDPATPIYVAKDPCADYRPNADQYPLQLCEEGDGVRTVQTALITAGYALVADGFYGPNTQAAVRRFQQRVGLTVDGLTGPDTWAALQAADPQTGVDRDGSGVVDPWEVDVS